MTKGFLAVAFVSGVMTSTITFAAAQPAKLSVAEAYKQAEALATRAEKAAKDAAAAAQEAKEAADVARELADQARTKLPPALKPIRSPMPVAVPVHPKDCSIDDDAGRKDIYDIDGTKNDRTPNSCVQRAYENQAVRARQNGIVVKKPISNPEKRQLRDRRGFTGKFVASSAASQASLEYTNMNFFRTISKGGEQRINNSTFTVGVRADVDDGKKSAQLASLDSLSSGLVGKLAYGRNYYNWEERDSVLKRAKKMHGEGTKQGAVNACLAAQKEQKKQNNVGGGGAIECTGQGLIDWMFAFKPETGSFKNEEQVDAFNSVYWGAKEAIPRWGWGVEGEVGRPKFTYIPFETQQIADPLRPGETITVLDPAQFPVDLKTATVPKDAKLNWSLKGYAYKHWPAGSLFNDNSGSYSSRVSGTTVIGSLAYKREWSIPKSFRDIEICPDLQPGQNFVSDVACTEINGAEPTLEKGFVLGAEVRQLIDVTRYLPQIGVAPRYTHSFDTDRNGFELPVYFAFDDDGKLSGGVMYSRAWGGRDSAGRDLDSENLFSIFFGTTFSLDGSQ